MSFNRPDVSNLSVHPSFSYTQSLNWRDKQQDLARCPYIVIVTNLPQPNPVQSSLNPPSRQGLSVIPPLLNPSSFSMICFIHTLIQPCQVNGVAWLLIHARNKAEDTQTHSSRHIAVYEHT